MLKSSLTESIQQQYRPSLIEAYQETAKQIPSIIKEVINNTPFRNDKLLCEKLYLSITLTFLNDITIPRKLHKKLSNNVKKLSSTKGTKRVINTYANNIESPILWHIDDRYQNYIRILTTKVKKILTDIFTYTIHSNDLSSDLIDRLLRGACETYEDKGDIE